MQHTFQHMDKEAIDDPGHESIDQLQAKLFFLMTRYTTHPCHHIASHIVDSLTLLSTHPHIELFPMQRQIYSQSINLWRSRLLESMPGEASVMH